MRKLYAVGIGLIGLLLVAGGSSPGWASCLISVTGASTGDLFGVVEGGNGVLQYSFFDVDGTAGAACTQNCFDTDGDGQAETTGDGHSGLLFSPSASGELSNNLDQSGGNQWPGIANTGSTTFQPLPGSPSFASGASVTCAAYAASATESEILIIGRDGQGNVAECSFDLDGNQTFIQGRNNSANGGAGDLDDDGWYNLSTNTPCRDVP